MALVNKTNRKIGLKTSKSLAEAINDSRYSSKYFENRENLMKSISLKRNAGNLY